MTNIRKAHECLRLEKTEPCSRRGFGNASQLTGAAKRLPSKIPVYGNDQSHGNVLQGQYRLKMEKSQVSSSLSTSLTGHVGSAVHLSTMHVTKLVDQSFTETNSIFHSVQTAEMLPKSESLNSAGVGEQSAPASEIGSGNGVEWSWVAFCKIEAIIFSISTRQN